MATYTESIRFSDSSGKVISHVVQPFMVELKPRDIMQIIVGTSILAIPVGFTEETWNLGERLPLKNIFILAAVSLLFISSFVYFNFYCFHLRGHFWHYIKRVVAIYFVTLVVVSSLLTIIIMLTLVFTWGIKLTSLWVFTTSILGVIGIAFFATWSYLSNIFAALVLFFTVPFKVDDKLTVMDNNDTVTGIVIDMTLFNVFLRNETGNSIIVPNHSILHKTLVKHSDSKEKMVTQS